MANSSWGQREVFLSTIEELFFLLPLLCLVMLLL